MTRVYVAQAAGRTGSSRSVHAGWWWTRCTSTRWRSTGLDARAGHCDSAAASTSLADASAAGALQATLEVRRSNVAALRLYERLGFDVAAVRPNYYTDPEEDGLILWRHDLGFEPPDPQP